MRLVLILTLLPGCLAPYVETPDAGTATYCYDREPCSEETSQCEAYGDYFCCIVRPCIGCEPEPRNGYPVLECKEIEP